MNTAIAQAAERCFERMHFYDADITNFDASWIDGAETAADRGFGVVRHSFPRAATDAMITWMITRPALAMTFPGTLLPRLRQPLGGEVLLVRPAIEAIADDPFVRQRSDWGIDTVMTHATTLLGMGVYEHNALDGKRHALYGSLTDIRDMVLECLDAARSLRARPGPHPDTRFAADAEAPVPDDLKTTVAYDITATRQSIAGDISPPEKRILDSLGIRETDLAALDANRWGAVMGELLDRFQLEDLHWRSVVFRLWVERVIYYTTHEVAKGYDSAITYLEGTIRQYEMGARRSADGDGGQGQQREG
jgi:mannosylglycerate synthase